MFSRNTIQARVFARESVSIQRQMTRHGRPARRHLSRPVGALLAGLLVGITGACLPKAGTDVGNGLTVKLNLQLTPEVAAKSEAKALTTGVVVEQLWVSTVKYRLTPGTDCTKPDSKIDIPGPAFADLLGPGFVGSSPTFKTMTGSFCKLQFEFEEADPALLPAAAPPELGDASLFLRGHRVDGVAFTVRSRSKEALRLDAKEGAFVLGADDGALVVGFDIEAAVAALELDTFTTNPIVFDATTNTPQLKAFEKSIRVSSKLFADDDEDGKLSDDETDAEHELGEGAQ